MTREQLLGNLITKCGSLVRAAQAVDPAMTDPTADYGLYALAMDQALRQVGVAETSLSDDTVVAAQPAFDLLWLATLDVAETLLGAFAGQGDIRVQNSSASGVTLSGGQVYKQAADLREVARKAVARKGYGDGAFTPDSMQLDYLEPAPAEFSSP
jgi:hypothetical protein